MNCPERVAGHVGGETVTRPTDERIAMVGDDEDFLDWQRDWLAENRRG